MLVQDRNEKRSKPISLLFVIKTVDMLTKSTNDKDVVLTSTIYLKYQQVLIQIKRRRKLSAKSH